MDRLWVRRTRGITVRGDNEVAGKPVPGCNLSHGMYCGSSQGAVCDWRHSACALTKPTSVLPPRTRQTWMVNRLRRYASSVTLDNFAASSDNCPCWDATQQTYHWNEWPVCLATARREFYVILQNSSTITVKYHDTNLWPRELTATMLVVRSIKNYTINWKRDVSIH
jgi:hypothetical protein